MIIKHKFQCVDDDMDTDTEKLVCVGKKKYGEVLLCVKSNMNIPIAKIRLHSEDLAVDADAVFEDAEKLGEEIAYRWNQFPIDMILHCPNCGKQHIDEAEPDKCQDCGHEKSEHFNAGERNICGGGKHAFGDEKICKCDGFEAWLNPPHKSHRCHNCNHVWRPANVPTNGVKELS